jgi:hypothetical protein
VEITRDRTFRGVHEPALVVRDGEHIFEDCRFSAHEFWQVAVVEGGAATFRRCRFEDGINRGLVATGGSVVCEDCTFAGNRAAVWVTGAATTALLTDCRIEGPGSAGIFFQKGATGRLARCVLDGSDDGGIIVRSGATPIIAECTIAAKNAAVHYEAGGGGEMVGCTVRGGVVGVWVTEGASPILRDCRIEGASSTGLAVRGGGRYERCSLDGNAIGVVLQQGSDPDIVDCTVSGGSVMALCALDGARGRVAGCRFGPHPQGGAHLLPGALTELRQNADGNVSGTSPGSSGMDD